MQATRTQSIESLASRFWTKVDVRSPGECWPWMGSVHVGYGRISAGRVLGGPVIWEAHRVSHVLTFGEIPSGLEIDHVCHTLDPTCPAGPVCTHRRCVNPGHLEPVTHHENALRREARKLHCSRGHLREGNRGLNGPSSSRCAECHRIKMQHFRDAGHYAWPGDCGCHDKRKDI